MATPSPRLFYCFDIVDNSTMAGIYLLSVVLGIGDQAQNWDWAGIKLDL